MIESSKSKRSTDSCRCSQCDQRATAEDGARWRTLAMDEAEEIQRELEKHYADRVSIVGGELRYYLLWRLSELERVESALRRCAQRLARDGENPAEIGVQITELRQRSAELQEETRVLLEAWQQSNLAHKARRPMRSSGTSSRRTMASFA